LLLRFPIVRVLFSTLSSAGLFLSLALAAGQTTSAGQSASASAQEPSQQQSSQDKTTATKNGDLPTPLRVTARLVQINVIVNDKHGNPISGLTKEDFVLFDNKHPQEIQLFSAETNLPRDRPQGPLPPDTYTNRISEHAGVPANVTVILLDALNTEFADQALTRKQVLKLLEQLRPQDRVALYWLGNNLYVLNDFTTDVASLREALVRSKGESNRELAESDVNYLTLNNPNPSIPAGVSGSQNSSREAFRSAFDQRVANESTKDRVRLTVAALTAIAHHVGALNGRKNLVWVSGSFPFSLGNERFDLNWANDTGVSFSAQIERAAQALTDADIAVYPVDARGLMGSGLNAAGDYSEAPPPEFSGEGNEHLPSRVAPGNLDTMKTLAERTGGKAFYGSNDLAEAMRRAVEDSRVTYTLGFYPGGAKWDGSFHNVKVRVKTPGAEVRARTGYFALPDSAQATPKSVQAIISQTAISQLESTGIGMRVHVQPGDAAGEHSLRVDLHLSLRDIHLEQDNETWTGALQTVFLQLNSRGEIIQAADETLQLTLPQTVYSQALVDGLKNTKHIRIVPGAARLCIVLRDASNGNIGSLSVPLAKYFPTSATPAVSH
jgi:VWFA-related protein